MVALRLFVPLQVDDPLSQHTPEQYLFADRVEEPVSNDLYLQSAFECSYVRADAVHLYFVETERRRLSRELLPVQGHVHIELERFAAQILHFGDLASDFTIFISTSDTNPVLLL